MEDILEEIKQDEGWREAPYNDSLGLPTIGYGTLLPLTKQEARAINSDREKTARLHLSPRATEKVKGEDAITRLEFYAGLRINRKEGEYLLRTRLESMTAEVFAAAPTLAKLDPARKAVIMNMTYQMGVTGVLGFKSTIRHIQAGEYAKAADCMLASKWAKQTPKRAMRLAAIMRNGRWDC
ncbi:MAG: glycoside hydrolase family protein [Helicobacteraceae bacterium]|jgi:lysozyme|nr:glycoside hydrolase family protein [Helicobacteraceae bacterium]